MCDDLNFDYKCKTFFAKNKQNNSGLSREAIIRHYDGGLELTLSFSNLKFT